MFTLSKSFRFEASHILPRHKGKCGRLHGHSWQGAILVTGSDLKEEGSSSGMLVDYGDLSAILKPLVEERLDHYHLNESLGLTNPTSEEVARWVYDAVAPQIPKGLILTAVQIEETCTSKAVYSPGDVSDGLKQITETLKAMEEMASYIESELKELS